MVVTKETIYYPSEERIPWPDFLLLLLYKPLQQLIEQYVNENYIELVKTWESEHSQKIEWNSNLSKGLVFLNGRCASNWTIVPLKCHCFYFESEVYYLSIKPLGLLLETFQAWEKICKEAYHFLTPEKSILEGKSKLNLQINKLYQQKKHKYNYWLLYKNEAHQIYSYCFKSKNAILDQIERIKTMIYKE